MTGTVTPDSATTVTFVLEDSFHIRGRGWVLAPALPMDQFPANAELAISMVEPDGTARTMTGRFLVEHLRLMDGSSKWDGVVVLAEDAEKVPAGSKLICTLSGSPLPFRK